MIRSDHLEPDHQDAKGQRQVDLLDPAQTKVVRQAAGSQVLRLVPEVFGVKLPRARQVIAVPLQGVRAAVRLAESGASAAGGGDALPNRMGQGDEGVSWGRAGGHGGAQGRAGAPSLSWVCWVHAPH